MWLGLWVRQERLYTASDFESFVCNTRTMGSFDTGSSKLLVYCSLSPGLSLAVGSEGSEEISKCSEMIAKIPWGQVPWGLERRCPRSCPCVCNSQLPGLRPKALWLGGETTLETEVYWEKLEVMPKCCVEALEDTAVTGNTLNCPSCQSIALPTRLSWCCKFEKLPCWEISASAGADKYLGSISSSSVGLENCLFGNRAIYGIIILFTGSSLNSSPFIMSFERTGK